MPKTNLIQHQYSIESSLDNNHSPLSLGSDNVVKNPQDYDLVRLLQRQVNHLQQELRKLYTRQRELQNELSRLRNKINK